MKMGIVIFILFVANHLAAQFPEPPQHKYQDNSDTCLSTLEYYSPYWKKDTLGKNGFRELFGQFILNGCDCKGRQWSVVQKFLGKPNRSFHLEGTQTYRYRLNHFTKDMKDIGTILLDVDVDKAGKITRFVVWEVDG